MAKIKLRDCRFSIKVGPLCKEHPSSSSGWAAVTKQELLYQVIEDIKALKPGQTLSIKYYTDKERKDARAYARQLDKAEAKGVKLDD